MGYYLFSDIPIIFEIKYNLRVYMNWKEKERERERKKIVILNVKVKELNKYLIQVNIYI